MLAGKVDLAELIQVMSQYFLLKGEGVSKCVMGFWVEVGEIPPSVKYFSLNDFTPSTTEANKSAVCVAGKFTEMLIHVKVNSLGGDAVFTLRNNGADTALTITVGAGETGLFFIEVDVSIAKGDLVCMEMDLSAGVSGMVSFTPCFVFEPS